MASWEQRYSYVEAAREIESTPEVKKFLARVERMGEIVLGSHVTALLHPPVVEADELGEQEPVHEHLDVGRINFESPLRYAQFTRSDRRPSDHSRDMAKVYGRFDNPDDHNKPEGRLGGRLLAIATSYGLAERDLVVTASSIDSDEDLPIYSLVIDDSTTAQMLREQNAAIFAAVQDTGPGSDLCRGQQPKTELTVPFATLPSDIDPEKETFFEQWISKEVALEPLTLVLGDLEWNSGSRSRP